MRVRTGHAAVRETIQELVEMKGVGCDSLMGRLTPDVEPEHLAAGSELLGSALSSEFCATQELSRQASYLAC